MQFSKSNTILGECFPGWSSYAQGEKWKGEERKKKRDSSYILIILIRFIHCTLYIQCTRAGWYGYPGSSSHILPEHNICPPKFSVGFSFPSLFLRAPSVCARVAGMGEEEERKAFKWSCSGAQKKRAADRFPLPSKRVWRKFWTLYLNWHGSLGRNDVQSVKAEIGKASITCMRLNKDLLKVMLIFSDFFKIFPFSINSQGWSVYLQRKLSSIHRQVTTTNNYSKHNCCSVSEIANGGLQKAFLLLLPFPRHIGK